MVVYDIWRRIPHRHRRTLLEQAWKHGPSIARQAIHVRKKKRGLL
jgi:hypothetical protein